jgi:prepilin-type N-terminal cleavage/methylation domain-containing protein/prepilin-type processing-associated H-X9-DG protein
MGANTGLIRESQRGFTLLELLIVISIISVLTAMLAPSLQKTKEQANRAKCANNLRQIGAALYMYLNDREEKLPGCYNYSGWNSSVVETNQDIQYVLRAYFNYSNQTNSMDSSVWVCPSTRALWWPEGYTGGFNPGLKKFGAPAGWGYKHNVTYRYNEWRTMVTPPVALASVKKSSEAAIMWDLPDDEGNTGMGWSYTYAHGEVGVDVLFVDGHVATVKGNTINNFSGNADGQGWGL